MKSISTKWIAILEKVHPKFKELNEYVPELLNMAYALNEKTRNYVSKNKKTCYVVPRSIRQSILSVLNYIIQGITRCVQYKDPSNSRCLTKKKQVEVKGKNEKSN